MCILSAAHVGQGIEEYDTITTEFVEENGVLLRHI
jgi:hypothetical protein